MRFTWGLHFSSSTAFRTTSSTRLRGTRSSTPSLRRASHCRLRRSSSYSQRSGGKSTTKRTRRSSSSTRQRRKVHALLTFPALHRFQPWRLTTIVGLAVVLSQQLAHATPVPVGRVPPLCRVEEQWAARESSANETSPRHRHCPQRRQLPAHTMRTQVQRRIVHGGKSEAPTRQYSQSTLAGRLRSWSRPEKRL